jgi:hypothetical protein
MHLRFSHVAIVVAGLILALSGGSLRALYREWQAGYTQLFEVTTPINWLGYFFDYGFSGLTQSFVNDETLGAPIIRIYVPERARSALIEALPFSVKNWQRGYRLYDDGKLRKIKVRHRGDNPVNWLFKRKSWRVKTSKKRTIGNVRTFDYTLPQGKTRLEEYLSYWLAQKSGVLGAPARMVELFVNDEPQGLYLETNRLDENFLRNAGYMPVNMYKGEQQNVERRYQGIPDLFDNAQLWPKISLYNRKPENDFSDLSNFLDTIRRAETSDQDFSRLKRLAPFDIWARFAAFQVLAQSWHNDRRHNMRLISDVWRGEVTPVVHDTTVQYGYDEGVFLERAPHALSALYERSSGFLLEKYRILHDLVVKDGVLEAMREEIKTRRPDFLRTLGRDGFKMQQVYVGAGGKIPTSLDDIASSWDVLDSQIENLNRTLREIFKSAAKGEWRGDDGRLVIMRKGPLPLVDPVLSLFSDDQRPEAIAWDRDGNGKLSEGDLRIPFSIKGDDITLHAAFFANRVITKRADNVGSDVTSGSVSIAPTNFVLVADKNLEPRSIKGGNGFVEKMASFKKGAAEGVTPGRLNPPVIAAVRRDTKIWRGIKTIEGRQIIEDNISIQPGTEIKMAPGASVVFRGRLNVKGTPHSPVRIVPLDEGKPWGTFALQGGGAKGSRLSHVVFEHGSGDTINTIPYTAMVSVHDTKDVIFNGLKMRNNHVYDDMMHVIYSQEIVLRNIDLQGALSDGIDVDISHVAIEGGVVSKAGNDAIDLMTSRALLRGLLLQGSGDKGVSVGEGSDALIVNTRLRDNAIGVQSKDGSITRIVASDLSNNKIQVHAYWKNWRYGRGGTVVLAKDVISGEKNEITAEKRSQISISDSTLSPLPKTGKKVSIGPLSDADGGRRARDADLDLETVQALRSWGVTVPFDRRGATQ